MSDIESLRFPSGRSVGNCRKDAKRLARLQHISLNQAQDGVASDNGLSMSWAKAMATLRSQAQIPIAQPHGFRMTEADIRAVMEKYPELTHYGLGICRDYRNMSWQERMAKFREERENLAGAVDECNRVVQFLMHAEKRKTINYRRTSYGLKHRAEHYMKNRPDVENYYVANGSFICAAVHMGFRFVPASVGSPNVCFNISERSPIFEWEKLLARAHNLPLARDKLSHMEKLLGVKPRYAHVVW